MPHAEPLRAAHHRDGAAFAAQARGNLGQTEIEVGLHVAGHRHGARQGDRGRGEQAVGRDGGRDGASLARTTPTLTNATSTKAAATAAIVRVRRVRAMAPL